MGNNISYSVTPTTLDLGSQGSLSGLSYDNKVKRFLNIPFALPPTGPYRWRKPRPLPSDFHYGDARDCTKFGPLAPQPGKYTSLGNSDEPEEEKLKYDEDCLTLNVWMPAGEPPEGGWPVVLWYHGGWMQVGDASVDPNMDPTELISSTGAALQCIFIASAYRLSALGFLASSELADEAASLGEENVWGNYGLWDQRLALDWVHENVGKWFGGNTREKLTLAGRSAGAYSVHAQVCHEFFMRKGEQKDDAPMFNRLIMYSNAIPTSPKSLSDVQPQFEELLTACSIPLSLSGPEKLARLRSIPARELTSKVMGLKMHTFRPVLDGAFFPTDLFDRFKNGEFAKEFERRRLELLIGEVRDEETIYRQTNPPDSLETLHLQVSNYYPSHVTDKLIDAYLNRKVHLPYAHPDPDPNIDAWKKVYGDIISDGQVRAPSRLLIDQLRHANVPLSRVHRYLISYRPSFMDRVAPATLGVGHAFDKPIWNFSIMHGPTEEEEKAMRAWIADLREFVNHGLSEETGGKGYGTKEWEEYKVLTEDGKIEVRKDAKWAYLLEVGEIMAV